MSVRVRPGGRANFQPHATLRLAYSISTCRQLTSSPAASVHVSLVAHMKTKSANELSMYEALSLINRSFGQILQELERIQQIGGFKGRALIKAVELAVKETRAWTLFEILDVLHQREEEEWTRFGRARSRLDQRDSIPAPSQAQMAKQAARSKKV
jgi:hypothetical protein